MDLPSPLPQYWAAIMPTPMLKPVTSRLRKNCTLPAWDTEAITPVAALEDCAENLTANLTGSSIRLALGTSVPSVAQYASRVFVTTERANDVLSVTDAMTEVLADPATQLVFVTTSHDTRFDASGVIRPLLGDSSGE